MGKKIVAARILFNWGYHDGVDPAVRRFLSLPGRRPAAYLAGARAGASDAVAGLPTASSTPSWETHRAEQAARRAARGLRAQGILDQKRY